MDGAETPLHPAATVVVIRDGLGGLETLMLRRNAVGIFGGMWVFPGGRVDPEDSSGEPADEMATARRAAVREAAEEAGLAIPETALVPFSHWTPPPAAPRRFATWFFLAPAPADPYVSVDGSEIDDHAWLAPADALARRDAGEIQLAPPTWVTLWRLAAAADVADALERARRLEPERFATRVGTAGAGGLVALWHGDAGYETGDADLPGDRHRLWMLEDGWRYEWTAAP